MHFINEFLIVLTIKAHHLAQASPSGERRHLK